MITGRAGTGKTTLIRALLDTDERKQVVVAPTGVAAVNVGGQTIHSFFRIPPRLHNLDEIHPRRGGAKLFKNLERVIIDEISMVRADLLDAVDYALQINRKDSRPFGGVQMVLVGDFLQLPPVVKEDEADLLEKMGYQTPYAFSAKCLEKVRISTFELKKIFRQDDPEFIRLLGDIRSGENLEETISRLNADCLGPHKTSAPPIILTSTNAVADRYNLEGLNFLPSQCVTYGGVISGEFNIDKDKLPVPELLSLKVGARIMMVKNDKAKRWVNGSLGSIVRLGRDQIWIDLDDNYGEYEVGKESWENIRYEWNDDDGKVTAKVVGSYCQLPVIAAWALTIHKAQGLTLENVRIDLASGAFAPGQAYVALSRARDRKSVV
jgi:ATP-dependent exoDNAse (exonuclease V) alpha subunit